MMGRQSSQLELIFVDMESMIPNDPLLRSIEQTASFNFIAATEVEQRMPWMKMFQPAGIQKAVDKKRKEAPHHQPDSPGLL